MSDLMLCIAIVILGGTSFFCGFLFCLYGVNQKVNELHSNDHHNGMKWIKFTEWLK